jgi:CoA-transferase family III
VDDAAHDPQPPAAGPLSGITVVTLEQAVAAPFATRQLADLGARVIKIERPVGGDFARRYDRPVPEFGQHTKAVLGELDEPKPPGRDGVQA